MHGEKEYDLNEEYFGDIEMINRRLTELNPEVLITLPSILNKLVKEVEKVNVDSPKMIKVSAEPPTSN